MVLQAGWITVNMFVNSLQSRIPFSNPWNLSYHLEVALTSWVLFFQQTCTQLKFLTCIGSGNGSGKLDETSGQPPPTARMDNCSTIQCSEGFSCSVARNVSFCLPVCGSWEQLPHGAVVAVDVVVILSAVIGVVASIAVIVISCIRWDHM